MGKYEKVLERVVRGRSDANIAFDDLVGLVQRLGFGMRVHGSHHTFSKNDVEEIINLQPIGHQAKAYQVKQVRNIVVKYKLGISNDDASKI